MFSEHHNKLVDGLVSFTAVLKRAILSESHMGHEEVQPWAWNTGPFAGHIR